MIVWCSIAVVKFYSFTPYTLDQFNFFHNLAGPYIHITHKLEVSNCEVLRHHGSRAQLIMRAICHTMQKFS